MTNTRIPYKTACALSFRKIHNDSHDIDTYRCRRRLPVSKTLCHFSLFLLLVFPFSRILFMTQLMWTSSFRSSFTNSPISVVIKSTKIVREFIFVFRKLKSMFSAIFSLKIYDISARIQIRENIVGPLCVYAAQLCHAVDIFSDGPNGIFQRTTVENYFIDANHKTKQPPLHSAKKF